jgi:uncharacterized protein (DUF169 family)
VSEKESLNKLSVAVDKYIRPITFPVAVKFQNKKVAFPGKSKRPLNDIGNPIALCQGVTLARRLGWSMVLGKEDHGCPVGLIVLGYYSPEKLLEGDIAYPYYAENVEIGRVMEQSGKFLPMNSIEEIWISPLHKAEFQPDIVLVYGNAAQVARMAQGANYSTGKGVDSKTFGRMACSSYLARTYVEQECSLVVPSGGERVFANTMDDELIFSIPATCFKQVSIGIEAVHREGLSRFPTYFYGMSMKPEFPSKYLSLLE